MPKSVEELFDGAEQSPHEEAAQLAQEVTEQQPNATEEASPPAPEEQKPEAEKPPVAAGKEEGAPPAPEDNDGRDPAFGRLRKERNDYREQLSTEKVERARLEERYTALEQRFKALEAQQQKPAQPQTPPENQIPDPNKDPVGFAAYQAQLADMKAISRHLNMSEDLLREKEGDEAVDKAVSTFQAMIRDNPALHQTFLGQRNPYKWMFAEVRKRQVAAEIGNDPDGFRAKVEAEARAKAEAEYQAKLEAAEAAAAETRSAPRNLPPSLGRVPNAGARSVTHTGPVPIDQLWGS